MVYLCPSVNGRNISRHRQKFSLVHSPQLRQGHFPCKDSRATRNTNANQMLRPSSFHSSVSFIAYSCAVVRDDDVLSRPTPVPVMFISTTSSPCALFSSWSSSFVLSVCSVILPSACPFSPSVSFDFMEASAASSSKTSVADMLTNNEQHGHLMGCEKRIRISGQTDEPLQGCKRCCLIQNHCSREPNTAENGQQ